jgi:hypothetical protein
MQGLVVVSVGTAATAGVVVEEVVESNQQTQPQKPCTGSIDCITSHYGL